MVVVVGGLGTPCVSTAGLRPEGGFIFAIYEMDGETSTNILHRPLSAAVEGRIELVGWDRTFRT